MKKEMMVISGTILDDKTRFTLIELCQYGKTSAEYIIEMVDEGILDPVGSPANEWVFDAVALKRLQTVQRLQRDLKINLPGAALVLELLDEMQELRQRLNSF